ncbi:MAG: amino acid adenylation domain-containing protein, partial [Acidimicrobiales bacterium]
MTNPAREKQLADLIEARRSRDRHPTAIAPVEAREPAPLSTVQLGLWTMAEMHPESGSGNRPMVAEISGPLDEQALQLALHALLDRHEALRTTYPLEGSEPVQRVVAHNPGLEVIWALEGDLDEWARLVRHHVEAADRELVDLTKEVLFKPVLIRATEKLAVLVIALHHIAFDGWSEAVFRADLLELYRATVDGDDAELPELPVTFSDYCRWERTATSDHEMAAELEFWRSELAGLGHAPNFTDEARRKPESVNSEGPVTVKFTGDQFDRIRELAKRENTTPFVVLLAGLEMLGRDLLDADDFLTMCPFAGRDRPETQHLIGCFINHLYVRSSLTGAETRIDHLRRVRARVAGALAHRRVPNREVLDQFGTTAARPRLQRFSLQWRDFPDRQASAPVDIAIGPHSPPGPGQGLALYVAPIPQGAVMEIQFNPSQFDRDLVKEWAEQLRDHVEALCADGDEAIVPAKPTSVDPDPRLPLLPDAVEPLPTSIARAASTSPDAHAVEAVGGHLTYRELWDRSGSLAGHLVHSGVEPGATVAIRGHRSPGFVVSLLAVLRAGAVAVPLDSDLPTARLEVMAAVARVSHQVLVGRSIESFGGEVPTSQVDAWGNPSVSGVQSLARTMVPPKDDRAYVMFTSGTTGTPRGVVGTHQGLAHFLLWERARLGVSPEDRIAGVTGPSFDVSLREVFLPLTAGATLVLSPPGFLPDAGIGSLTDGRITLVHITPSMAAAWLAESTAPASDEWHSSLRWTVFAGEPLHSDLVHRWRSATGSGRVLNLYGPTETCLAKASFEVGLKLDNGVQPVGHALPHSQLLVVDPAGGEPATVGQVGEVHVRTSIGTAGLLDEHSSGFVSNPFWPDDPASYYRTGDLGWRDANGAVHPAGRMDDQVKIDGVRVEPLEVQALLTSHEDVTECVVLPLREPEASLVAFVVADTSMVDDTNLRKFLAAHVRFASIPSRFVHLESIPLGANGKPSRSDLFSLLSSGDPGGSAASVPANPSAGESAATGGPAEAPALLEAVASVWSAVLGRELGPSDDFFEAGGTSLRAQRIIARLEDVTGVRASVDLILDHPRLQDFAKVYSNSVPGEAPAADAASVVGAAEADDIALSFAQERLWIVDQQAPGSTTYLVYKAQLAEGPLDVAALGEALTDVVTRHETLRSRFLNNAGLPQVVIDPPSAVPVDLHDIRDHLEDKMALAGQMVDRFTDTPFELESDRLVRAHVIRIAEESWLVLIVFHHIVMDGQSYPIFNEELRRSYQARLRGGPADLVPLPAQYGDFATHQRELAERGEFEEGLRYWEDTLSGRRMLLSLRSSDTGGDPDVPVEATVELDVDVGERWVEVARELKATRYMVGLAVFVAAILDHEEAENDEDAVVSLVTSDRSWPSARKLIGYFVNTLPLRIGVDRDATLAEAVASVREVMLGALQHGDVPLDLILDRMRSGGMTDHVIGGLDFDVTEGMMGLLNFGDDVNVSTFPQGRATAKFDLSISVNVTAPAPVVRVRGRSSMYTQEIVDALAQGFGDALKRGFASPDLASLRRGGRLGTGVGASSVSDRSGGVPRTTPRADTVLAEVGRRVRADADAPAIVGESATWTMSELWSRACRIATILRGCGVEHGDRVAIDAHRSPMALAVMYGTWAVGASYVPIDTDAPQARNQLIVEGCRPTVFVTARPGVELAEVATVLVDEGAVAGVEPMEPMPVRPTDEAYVIHTSGSTGRPKGVMISHGALSSYIEGACERYGLTSNDRMLQFHSLAFDASVEEIHLPLAVGATVVLRADALLGSARRLFDYISEHQVTMACLPTALWHEVVSQMSSSPRPLPQVLDTVIIGGEPASAGSVRAWLDLAESTKLINSYGPTECTVVALSAVLSRAETSTGAVSVGTPLRDVDIRIVDGSAADVQPGQWGELWLGGPQLAIGYVREPGQTQEAFVYDASGTRWYRSGDRARLRADGEVELSGRLDDQVKIDGHRIELGEIEHALTHHPSVSAAAVLAVGEPGELSLHGFVTLESSVSAEELRSDLAERLPSVMVPPAIEVVAQFPLGHGDKVDRAALRRLANEPVSAFSAGPAPEPEVDPGQAPAATEPDPDLVGAIGAIWSELLDRDEIDRSADFFELGGRSLTAVRMAYLIEERVGVSLPVVAVFEGPTIEAVARRVSELRSADNNEEPDRHVDEGTGNPGREEPLPPSRVETTPIATQDPVPQVAPVPPQVEPTPALEGATAPAPGLVWSEQPARLHLEVAPLSLAQQRIWLHTQLRPGELPYLIPKCLRLLGELDTEVLGEVLIGLFERHEVLRTRIVVTDNGKPLQVVDSTDGLSSDDWGSIEWVHLAHLDPTARAASARAIATEFSQTEIDLAHQHPLRVQVIGLGEQEHYLSLVFHHIAVDGQSIDLVLSELQADYNSRFGIGVAPRPPDLQFGDYAVWQRAQWRAGAHEASLAYWRDKLGPEPSAVEIPGVRPDGTTGGRVERHNVRFSPSTTADMLRLAERAGVSPFQLLVSITTAMFHRVTGSQEIIVGTPSTERSSASLDRLPGLFLNTMLLHNRVEGTESFVDLLHQVRQGTGMAIEHSKVPFDAIVEMLELERSSDRVPLVSVMCQFHEFGDSGGKNFYGLDVEDLALGSGGSGAVADLMVTASVREGHLTVTLRHDDSLIDPWVVGQLARSIDAIGNAVVTDPDTLIRDLPIVGPDEEQWLTEALNNNRAPFPERTRIDASFAEVAAAAGSRPAVIDDRVQLTYAELEIEARQLASDLQRLGVTPGHAVGLDIGRSVELVVAMLGIVMAGGVYVPIDSASPASRRSDVLETASVAVIVGRHPTGGLRVDTADREPSIVNGYRGDPAAYVMFTSGSTGVPKGVVVGHRAIQRTVQGVDYAPLGSDTVMAMVSNPAFDALTFEVWGALLNGGTVQVFDENTVGDPTRFSQELRRRGVTTMFLTSTLANLVTAAVPDAFVTLETLMVGGEALDVDTMRSLLRAGPARLVNGYGPTECTTFSAWYLIEELGEAARTVPIGGPTRNTELHVLDDQQRLVPRGVEGELCVGGPGLAAGYLGDPEMTQTRFVEAVVGDRLTRLYRTGDLVRRRADGVIEYLGRLDHQVKLRGFRIELGEVEAAVRLTPGVGSAVVKVVGEGSKRSLVAFVSGTNEVTPESVGETVAALVPAYMVPARTVVLDEMPLTRSGKVDRVALEEPSEAAVEQRQTTDPRIGRMAEVWRRTLGVATLGPDEDFFSRGGNSLLAMELLARIDDEYGVQLPLSAMFDARTPRMCMDLVDREVAEPPE